jgi:asparagine synthase (glutamine-hydrolysing)
MCGIYAFINLLKKVSPDYVKLYEDFMATKNRGPDMSSFTVIKDVSIGFHRLAIMDPTFHANQPYIMEDGERTIVFICNGEIYNFKDLITKHELVIPNNSDCMTIPKLYIKYTKYDPDHCTNIDDFTKLFSRDIKGEFAFVLFEFDRLQNLKQLVVGRDQIGIRPLYWNKEQKTGLLFSSEVKGMINFMENVEEFEPGSLVRINFDNFGRIICKDFYNFKTVYNVIPHVSELALSDDNYLLKVREAVINSVKRRLFADRPVAFLLSGGVDSSLVASISARLLGQPINTFCCGMYEGTDMLYARKVAEHIGSNHKEVIFTVEEGLNVIEDVIRTVESWDVTTIRASVGQYLVCKYIGTKTDARVVMVGEGPDEVCSSYLFNYYAPSGKVLHDCAKEYVKDIHLYDGRRADRCISRWGLEGRVPLLDPEFIETYWQIPANKRMPTYKNCEKWYLRKAFDDTGILNQEVLWRRKEAFSDGISGTEKSWYQLIQDHVEKLVSNEEFKSCNKWQCKTKEAYYYKKTFIKFFGEQKLNIMSKYWLPKWNAAGNVVNEYMDPSARVLTVYNS